MVTAPVTAPTPAPSTQPSSQSQAKEHIGVALPGDHFTSAWVFNWTRLFGDLLALFNVEPLFCYSTNVYATRTTIWEHFRAARPQPDYVLWIDDDNLVTFDNVVQLLQDLQARPDADIVTGWCWCGGDIYEQAESRISVGTLDSLGLTRFTPHSELMAGDEPLREIHFSGFPLLLMRRGVLQKLGPDAFAPLTGPQYSPGLCRRGRFVLSPGKGSRSKNPGGPAGSGPPFETAAGGTTGNAGGRVSGCIRKLHQ